jgi:hypothetical protein
VYCSGFGYTLKSNLVDDYDCSEICEREGLTAGMCAGPDGKVAISRICPGQRKGYDICPASEVGHDILAKAYEPLFESGIDYAQILDQNHGGGQYFCYSREHGHPPVPGAWMTENMQSMLTEWNGKAGNMLLGCESAAAEPFIGNMLMSDNRFELNYPFGKPVPAYAYIYHEYVRNFMGNQCGCPFEPCVDTLRYRLAYSFSIGDIMTLVLFQFDIVFQKLLFSVYADTDISVLLKLFKRILERSLLFGNDRCQDRQSGALRFLPYGIDHFGNGLAGDRDIVVRAVRYACSGIQQTEIVIYFRYGSYRGTGVVGSCLLIDGNRRRQSFDQFYIRFVHSAEKHSCVSAQ